MAGSAAGRAGGTPPAAARGSGPATQRIDDPATLRNAVVAARVAGRRVGFVPTMGALHRGHASLVEAAAAECDDVVVSVFVNPTQFGPGEDYTRYPRPLTADLELLATLGVRWIFVPEVSALYPEGAATRVVVAGPALPLEGERRPGHFAGVATVVCRLLHAVPADIAYFGAKDWQQTRVVRRMVADLGLPVEVRVCPTVREPDGLALSSRNAYLTPQERPRACGLFESLQRAAALWTDGATVAAVEAAMRQVLESRGIDVDYAVVVDAESLAAAVAGQPAVALVAGRLGSTRLIDTMPLGPRGEVG